MAPPFFSRFFRPKIDKDIDHCIQLMNGAASEADRVYRNAVKLVAEEGFSDSVAPDLLGLFRARVVATSCVVFGFMRRWPDEDVKSRELLNIASGVAISPYSAPEGPDYLPRDQATSVAWTTAKAAIAALAHEFAHGPSTPGAETQGHKDLTALYWDTLIQSLGTAASPAVRLRLEHMLDGWSYFTIRIAAQTL